MCIRDRVCLVCFSRLTKDYKNIPKNIELNELDAKLFQEKMKVCSGVICSGGFETSSEAIYQNKPLLMIPCRNHYEQYANSHDAKQAGFARYSAHIDLLKLEPKTENDLTWFDKINSMHRLIN